jgi:tellurium resistance protein TerZ
MALSLDQKKEVPLKKGDSILLKKNGKILQELCFGINWGSIVRKSFFGLIKDSEGVDLDSSATIFNPDKMVIETIYHHSLISKDGSVVHSGDDLWGDPNGDDGKDNEVIEVFLNKISDVSSQIVFFLNSYQGQDFSVIPYSKIRIFEGTPREAKTVFASFNLSAEPSFKGHVAMVMGKLYKTSEGWEFLAIGEPVGASTMRETIKIIQQKYLD